MPVLVKDKPTEGSTASITCTFKDTNNSLIDALQLNSIKWSLYDSNGNIVNNNENVEESKANPLTIVLTGDDLPAGKLSFNIHVVYDSTIGDDLNLRESLNFYVANILNYE